MYFIFSVNVECELIISLNNHQYTSLTSSVSRKEATTATFLTNETKC